MSIEGEKADDVESILTNAADSIEAAVNAIVEVMEDY